MKEAHAGPGVVSKALLPCALALAGLLTPPGCSAPTPPPGETLPFAEVGESARVDFRHWNGMTGDYLFPEIFGPGAALFDGDGDGDLDLYLVQGGLLAPGASAEEALFPPPGPLPLRDRLFRNDTGGDGILRFTDVTEASGIDGTGYGMGVAVGDYDGDGRADLYVTQLGPNRLWRNLGDLRFEETSAAAGAQDERWSTSAAFLDYDGDGRLDLYIGNYVNFPFADQKPCLTATGAPEYCGPRSYRPETDRLLRNAGGGRFDDTTVKSGLASASGPALGIVTADLDHDGLPDLYVANDGEANQFWVNQGDGTFRDQALLAGCAFNEDGEAEASMGIDYADFDDDGDTDLFMTHLNDETNTLYLNDGKGWFEDATYEAGLGLTSRGLTGFGTAWLDYDDDGRLDLIVVNGAVKTLERHASAGDPFPLRQPNQLFRNRGNGSFEETTEAAGEPFAREEVSRGAAVGDLDNDGDLDVVVTNNNGPVRLLLNQGAPQRWLGFRVLERNGRAPALGAIVTLPVNPPRRRGVRVASSYLSSNDPRVLFPLLPGENPQHVEVRWSDGEVERFPVEELGTYRELRRGRGR